MENGLTMLKPRHMVSKLKKEIKDLTPVRGQDGKILDTQGKDFWSPTRLLRVGNQ
jgi:hypothetical protein